MEASRVGFIWRTKEYLTIRGAGAGVFGQGLGFGLAHGVDKGLEFEKRVLWHGPGSEDSHESSAKWVPLRIFYMFSFFCYSDRKAASRRRFNTPTLN
jgi:hypothetical protein